MNDRIHRAGVQTRRGRSETSARSLAPSSGVPMRPGGAKPSTPTATDSAISMAIVRSTAKPPSTAATSPFTESVKTRIFAGQAHHWGDPRDRRPEPLGWPCRAPLRPRRTRAAPPQRLACQPTSVRSRTARETAADCGEPLTAAGSPRITLVLPATRSWCRRAVLARPRTTTACTSGLPGAYRPAPERFWRSPRRPARLPLPRGEEGLLGAPRPYGSRSSSSRVPQRSCNVAAIGAARRRPPGPPACLPLLCCGV